MNKPLLFNEKHSELEWNEWSLKIEKELIKIGYTKYFQNYKREDFSFWKPIIENGKKIFQIGILFYDFRKHNPQDPMAKRIGVQFECLLINENRIDLSVSKDISVKEFETMCYSFYESMKKYI
jgi:hypothetical protein